MPWHPYKALEAEVNPSEVPLARVESHPLFALSTFQQVPLLIPPTQEVERQAREVMGPLEAAQQAVIRVGRNSQPKKVANPEMLAHLGLKLPLA